MSVVAPCGDSGDDAQLVRPVRRSIWRNHLTATDPAIVGANGRPLTKESFGNEFAEACKAAGVPGRAHGLRKLAATTAANNGATVAQLKALFGWTSNAMPELYTKEADRERLGRDAGHTLANDERTSIPAPSHEVRAAERKRK